MKEFRTKAIINAPAAVVWQTIMDISNYPRFDPNCIKIEGVIKAGNHIKIYSKSRPNRGVRVRVTELLKDDKMVWEAGLPLNLFKGVRTFTVIAKDDYTTEFHMVEIFNGLLLGLIANVIPDMSDAFSQFSKGLKSFIESRP